MNTNYNNSLLLQQQQQLQQQQHQNPQQGGQQPQQQQQPPSLPPDQPMNQNNMDTARMQQWAQMRYGQNSGADMSHAKFAELMKRNQVATQFSRHQPQQSFPMGLGIQHGANVLGNPQQQSFHEQHSSSMTQQPHLSQAFPNMGVMSNGNANAAGSASLQGRNPSGVHPGSQAARPLDMMGMVQGQQPQNNSVNPNKFPQSQQPQLASLRDSQQMQFSQGLSQASPADMLPDGIRRPSPHPGNAMQQGPGLGQSVQVPHSGFMGNYRPPGFDFQQRMHLLQTSTKTLEAQLNALHTQAANYRGNEAQFNQKSNDLKAEIAKRKDSMTRLFLMWKQLQSGAQQSSLASGNGGQSSTNQWTSHAQPFDPNSQTRPPSMGLLPNPPTHTMQTSPSLSQASAQTNPLLNSGLLPPRTISTPQQPSQSLPPHVNGMGPVSFPKPNPLLPKGPTGSQSSIGNLQGGNGMTNFTSPISMLGMDKSQFDSNFQIFLTRRGGNIDPRLRFLENRPLDLHGLYIQVMQEGGFSKIEGSDNLWSIIAARLGHVQFPGTASEPAKSGPGVAQSIQHLYKEYIGPFEAWYMAMVQEFKKQSNAALQAALNGSRYTIQQLLQMVHMSPAELQSQGVDEKTMQILESQKVPLQRLLQEQRAFAESVRNNAAQNAGHGDQNGAMGHRPPSMGPSPPFGASGSQQTQQQNLLSIAGRPQLHHLIQQQGGHLQSTIPNGVDARMPGQMQAAMGNTLQNFAQKGSMNQVQAATQLVNQFKNDYAMSNFPNANLDVPIEQQVEYTQQLELLHRQCVDMERRLGLVAVILKDIDEGLLKRAVTILYAVNQQRHNLSSASGPRYIISLDQLRAMANDLGRINEIFVASYQNLKMQQMQKEAQQQGLRPQQPQLVGNPMAPLVVKSEMSSQPGRAVIHNRTPSEAPSQQPQTPQLQPPLNSNQTLRPPAPKRKPPQTPGSSAAASSPSPKPVTSTPTPVANAPTPTATASSPAAAKSPKTKASKSKAANTKQRRASKVVQSVTLAPNVEETKHTPPSSVTAGKRPRDESTSNSGGNGNNAESSEVLSEGSPKRVKTEWESQPSEAQRKQSEVVANIKTDEDATALFDQMTELIKRAAEEEGGQPSSITTGISETLDMLLKGYGPVPDAMDGYSGAGGESSSSREPDGAPALGDPFDEFFDFSFGTVEDEDSKTPDLVSSSSTNPSPESNHDVESGHHLLASASSSTIDVKTEDFSDPLRLGTWKEIDGGEAAYFQATEWKYDSPMASFDQPWAIFNS